MDKKRLRAKLKRLLERRESGAPMRYSLHLRIDALERLLNRGTKICKHCGEELLAEDFYIIAAMFDGLSPDCRTCRSSIGSENYFKRTYERGKKNGRNNYTRRAKRTDRKMAKRKSGANKARNTG